MLHRFKNEKLSKIHFEEKTQRPILRCSICTGEQVAGFKDIQTGKFQEVMVIRNDKDLDIFREMYGIGDVPKEY